MAKARTSPKARWTRWFQFRLGTLLLLITVFGVWLGIEVNRVNRQRRAVSAIAARKGLVKYDYQLDMNPQTATDPEPPGPRWLRAVIGDEYFCQVDWVDFATDYWGRRKELGLSKIDDEGLACLELIPTVTVLELGNNRAITDAGLVHLRDLKGLRTAYLYRSSVVGPGLIHLIRLRDLQVLDLTLTPLTDEGMPHIGQLQGLTALCLGDTRITDSGLVSLGSLKRLTDLRLTNTDVTDAGLKHLRALTSLERLELSGTKATPTAIDELRRALPDCAISRRRAPESTTEDP